MITLREDYIQERDRAIKERDDIAGILDRFENCGKHHYVKHENLETYIKVMDSIIAQRDRDGWEGLDN